MAVRKITRKNGIVYVAYFKHKGQQVTKTFYTQKEAKAWEVEAKRNPKTADATPPNLMFSRASMAYLEDCKARMAANTFKERQRHLREFATFLTEDVDMEDITRAVARKFLLVSKAEREEKSANRRLRTLKALWNWHKDTIPRNPWRGILPFKEEEYIKYHCCPAKG